jgi:acyl phosphate:glycerol-3-phosphate acyltransferase
MHVPTTTWTVAAVGLLAYLVGGVPVGHCLVRLTHPGVDVRTLGSGNVGTSNIYRNVDTGLAVVVGPLQFLQGLLPVLLAARSGLPTAVMGLAAVCAVIGNGWPVYLGFNGGRGIAVATGAVAGASPAGLCVLLPCYALGALAHEIAIGVLTGFLLLPLVAAVALGRGAAAVFTALLVVVLLRRLEGVVSDARRVDHPWRMLALRLARDQRPDRPLVGPRLDGQTR